jgi:hypothetical protein
MTSANAWCSFLYGFIIAWLSSHGCVRDPWPSSGVLHVLMCVGSMRLYVHRNSRDN